MVNSFVWILSFSRQLLAGLLITGVPASQAMATEPEPGVRYSPETVQKLETMETELDTCAKELEQSGAIYRSPGGETMRTLTPPIRSCYVRVYTEVTAIYDEAAKDLLDQAIATGNSPKCKQAAEKLINERPDFESVIRKLDKKPLGTNEERLMATLYMNGTAVAVITGGLGRAHMVGLTCAMEAGLQTLPPQPGTTGPSEEGDG